jgi:hypothetical protein
LSWPKASSPPQAVVAIVENIEVIEYDVEDDQACNVEETETDRMLQ